MKNPGTSRLFRVPLALRSQLDLPGHRVTDVIRGGAKALIGQQFFDPPPQCFVPDPNGRNLTVVCDVHVRLPLFSRQMISRWECDPGSAGCEPSTFA
jgi:hypothetical protein